MTDIDIKAFIKERDEVLISGDITKMMEFHNRYHPELEPMKDPEIAEVALHKSRTAVTSLPIEMRRASKAWLMENGYQSMDDGDL